MDDQKLPTSDNQSETQGLDKTSKIITQQPVVFSVGGDIWEEVPDGIHSAVCSKVVTDFNYRGIQKLMLYFTITEDVYRGYRARLSYNYSKDSTGPTFGSRSKFFKHIKKLFPEFIGNGRERKEFDPVKLFKDKHFLITTELRKGKDGDTPYAIVQDIRLDDVDI